MLPLNENESILFFVLSLNWTHMGWSPQTPGTIVLFTQFWSSSEQYGQEKTIEQLMWASAHEFGHALGIGDGPARYYSMMGTTWFASAYTLEIQMALMAHETGIFQHWHGNPIVARYGILLAAR